ncbi:chemotaxis protein CheW [Hydrogenophilus thermoluteolus]|uniref:chemotaxis protein CheW n=1 Tax=Hydrogenophilus thermoluteolus TaxID=297 RepID=UPI003F66215B
MAKRTDIRRFQETLAQKLAAAQHQSEGIAARWLGVMVGAQPVLLPLSATAGIIHEFTLTHVPFSPPHLRGLTNVRGELHDVIDFAPLMAIRKPRSAPRPDSWCCNRQSRRAPRSWLRGS